MTVQNSIKKAFQKDISDPTILKYRDQDYAKVNHMLYSCKLFTVYTTTVTINYVNLTFVIFRIPLYFISYYIIIYY